MFCHSNRWPGQTGSGSFGRCLEMRVWRSSTDVELDWAYGGIVPGPYKHSTLTYGQPLAVVRFRCWRSAIQLAGLSRVKPGPVGESAKRPILATDYRPIVYRRKGKVGHLSQVTQRSQQLSPMVRTVVRLGSRWVNMSPYLPLDASFACWSSSHKSGTL